MTYKDYKNKEQDNDNTKVSKPSLDIPAIKEQTAKSTFVPEISDEELVEQLAPLLDEKKVEPKLVRYLCPKCGAVVFEDMLKNKKHCPFCDYDKLRVLK